MWFSNFTDQRIYRVDDGGDPAPLTPEPPVPAGVRFADLALTPDGRWLIAVRETHGGDVVNDVAAVATETGEVHRLVGDTTSSPRRASAPTAHKWRG